jgi:hypothetical protein
MSLLRIVDIYTPLFGGDIEVPIYFSIARAKIESAVFMVGKTALKTTPNYTTLNFIDKGIDGTGTDIIFSINNNSGDPEAIDFIEFQPTIVVDKDDPDSYIDIVKGHVYILQKEDNAAGVNLGASSVLVNERRY